MSVAIPIPLLQNLPDVNVTPAVGVDEYALVYDHDTARFVLRAPAAPFAGILATGATVGATAQAQAFTLGVVSPFDAPAADSTTAWQVRKADKTTSVLNVDTTNARVGIGTAGPQDKLHIYGSISVEKNDYFRNWDSASQVNTIMPYRSSDGVMALNTYYWNSPTVGGFQFQAGGYDRLRITGLGLVGIGTTAPATILHVVSTTATTNALRNVLTLGANVTSTGVGAAGLGAAILFTAETTTTADTSAASVQAIIYEATHATRKFDLVLNAYDTAIREGLRIRGAGSEPAIGFYGVAPIARAILATGVGATADNIITALQNLGLVKQS